MPSAGGGAGGGGGPPTSRAGGARRPFWYSGWAAPLPLSLMGWTWIFDTTYSIINWTLQHLHLASQVSPPQWLAQPRLAMGSVITVHAWRIIPFATVIFLAGLASIPKEVDDAAAIDGATGFRKFWSVSLPLQLPIATVALLFGIVFTATDMAVVYILTNGGPPPCTVGARNRPSGVRGSPLAPLLRESGAGLALPPLAERAGRLMGVDCSLTCLSPPTLLFLPLFSVITQLDKHTHSLLHFHL